MSDGLEQVSRQLERNTPGGDVRKLKPYSYRDACRKLKVEPTAKKSRRVAKKAEDQQIRNNKGRQKDPAGVQKSR